MSQTNLECLIIMAYNIGRAHGENRTMSIEEGRAATVKHCTKFFDDIDPGDLALPVNHIFQSKKNRT